MKGIAVIDYGAGNLESIANAVKKTGGKPFLAKKPGDLAGAGAIILPGVGSFSLVKSIYGMRDELLGQIGSGKPFLGICLGMQFLFEKSEEAEGKGLGVFKGKVAKLPKGVKIPHIGWNQVEAAEGCGLFKGVPANSFFYFDHSFYAQPEEKEVACGWTEYGKKFASAVGRGNAFGVQFHPEKSADAGLKVFSNFLKMAD